MDSQTAQKTGLRFEYVAAKTGGALRQQAAGSIDMVAGIDRDYSPDNGETSR